jgi:enoyl-CoA hydratase/carnithine racemase
MDYESLIVERRGPVGWITLNRPEALNSHSIVMHSELPRAWHQMSDDDEVRVVVITGAGRAFATGADVKELASAGGMAQRLAKVDPHDEPSKRPTLGPRAQEVWKPVIAAVNGVCAGGGLHYVAEADIVLASPLASFVDTHVSVGQVAALEPISLVGRMPFGAIMRMALVGRHERLSATRAYELGMVDEIIDPPERLLDAAQALAETIAKNSPTAMMATKRAIWGAFEHHRPEALARGFALLESVWDHPDGREGPRAFAEKRDPQWAPPTKTF